MNHGSHPPPARLRDRLRDETARAILAAAEEVFADEGLQAARMERIAARAGVAVGTLYNHFEDKQSLLRSLARSRREALLERVDSAIAPLEGRPVVEQLRAFLSAVDQHARAHRGLLSVLVQAGEGPARPRPPRTLLADLVVRADAIVSRGVAAGELREDGANVFGLALVGMARAVLVRSIDGKDGAVLDGIVELFLRGAAR